MALNKNEDFIKLPFDEILRMNAYFEKRDKTSQRYRVFTNEQNDLVIISRNEKGHYLYFNPNDERDRGNIFNFAKNRGIRVEELLKGFENNLEIKPLETTNTSRTKSLEEYKEMKALAFNNHFFQKRLIDAYLIQEFAGLRQDKYHNINIPSFVLSEDKNFLTQAGFVSYLVNPLSDKEQPQVKIKTLCKGNKGLEIIKNASSKKQDIKTILITESMIDTFSLLELKDFNAKECLLCSTNGQITRTQKEVFAHLNETFNQAKVYLGFDRDKKGKQYSELTKENFPNAHILPPQLKDFNDDLMCAKYLNLDNEWNIKDCEKLLLGFEKHCQIFIKNFHTFSQEQRAKSLKQISTEELPKYERIKTKIKAYIDTKSLENSYKELSFLLERELKRG